MSVLGPVYEAMVLAAATNHAALATAEQERMGVDHCETGAWLLRRWNFPEQLANAVALSHGETDGSNEKSASLARLAAIAGVLADAWVEGRAAQVSKKNERSAAGSAADPLKAALARADVAIKEAAGMFNVELFDAPGTEWLLDRARQIVQDD